MNTSPSSAIKAVELSKIFRDFWQRPKVTAVDRISFEVHTGEIFGLLGPNGSGKSTTIKMILGLLHPNHGSLDVLGKPPSHVQNKMKIGYLPEESYIYPYLTARETLEFYSNLFPMQPQERKARVTELLEMVGLTQAGNRQVGEFSKGMARRVGLAQALINDPDLVILDEPTSGLDPIGCRQVKDLILMLAERGKTVLLCSHLLADVEDVCNRIAILYNGTIRAMGDMHSLLEEKSRHRFTVEEMPSGAMEPILAAFRSALGSEPHVDHPRRDLEQYFLHVVEQARRDGTEATGADHGGTQPEFLESTEPASEQESR